MSDEREWWEKGYPGGPMVPVPGFPRPLYPPDATGYEPSSDGPDVIAYKRTVSRAGRWPWEKFDDSFSVGFSHGRAGGNVGDSGVAGVQRQQKDISPTGYIGEKTFNTLRSIIIPDPLPHAGEYAMDVTAQNLIGEAWQMFKPKPSGTTRERALAGAKRWVGYIESDNNDTVFGQWYGANYQPWCAMFCSYCYEVEAGGSPSFARGSRWAFVPYIVDDARSKRNGLSVTQTPKPGDLVCYDFHWDGTHDHVGMFESGTSNGWNAIEGNTSPSSSGSQSNGGGCYRKWRTPYDAAIVFVRVAE